MKSLGVVICTSLMELSNEIEQKLIKRSDEYHQMARRAINGGKPNIANQFSQKGRRANNLAALSSIRREYNTK